MDDFSWGYKKAREEMEIVTSMLIKRLADLQNEVNALREEMRELTDSIKTLSDDMYDVQADLTLIHSIDGYEDWRSEIGKPVKVAGPIIEREWISEDWRSGTGKIGKPVSKPTDIVK